MRLPKISIIITTWNGEQYIRACLKSVVDQEYFKSIEDYNILVIDNKSDDHTIEFIEEMNLPNLRLVKNKINLGFAKGYNQGIHWSNGEYILILNQDVLLDKKYLSETINFLDNYQEVAVVTGKVLRWDYTNQRKTNIIDNCGIKLKNNLQVVNIFEGQQDKNESHEIKPVFGFSGSVALCRRTALNDIRYEQEFFDELFNSYKEDVDLSWRLRWRNWDIVYIPSAKAYHKRSIKQQTSSNKISHIINNYKTKPKLINYLSYRNHLYMIFKNCSFAIFRKNFITILWYEFKKVIYIFFVHPTFFKAWYEIAKNYKIIKAKKKQIKETKKISPLGLNSWIDK